MKKAAAFSHYLLLAAAFLAAFPAFAQKTTNIDLVNVFGLSTLATAQRPVSLSGTGVVSPLGSATVNFSGFQNQLSASGLPTIQGSLTFFFNRVDSFSVSVPPQLVNKTTTVTLPGTITGGTGIYSNASGSVTYTFNYTGVTSSAGTFTLSGSGNIKLGQTSHADHSTEL